MSQFPAIIELSSLDGSNGFEISGALPGDSAGRSVASAGDFNHDGYLDFIVAGVGAQTDYLIFGSASGFAANFDLSTLNGSNGFRLSAAGDGARLGRTVAAAGDVNNDGIPDVILGSVKQDNLNGLNEAYVVFGAASGFGADFDTSALNGTNGFRITGLGSASLPVNPSVAGAGDINGDGVSDVVVGSAYGFNGGSYPTGECFVVFGNAGGFAASIDTSTLDGSNGFRLIAGETYDDLGFAVSGAGDINGDGVDDLIVSAPTASPGPSNQYAGKSYVVFGEHGGFSASIDLSALNGTDGFTLSGVNALDCSGVTVASAGDVNGDGFADLLIGAIGPRSDPEGTAYVVFGKASGFTASLDLSTLDGTNGFKIDGVAAYDATGISVRNAGDINGDGLSDLIIGAYLASQHGPASGEAYVVYGRLPDTAVTRTGTTASQTLVGGDLDDALSGMGGDDHLIGNGGADTLDGGIGADTLDGGAGSDTASFASAVSAVSVNLANVGSQDTVGAGTDLLVSIENLSGSAFDDTLTGDAGANILSGGGGADTLAGGGYYDTFDGGLGTDTASFASAGAAVGVSLAISGAQDTGGGGVDTLVSIENLTGSAFDDILTGDSGANTLDGGLGNDTASFAFASAAVAVNLSTAGAQDTGGGGVDTLVSIENLIGSNFDDVLTGDGGDNTIAGGSGSDTIDGGAGNDKLDGGLGLNTASYASAAAAVSVSLTGAGPQDTGGDGIDILISIEQLVGSAFDDHLVGSAGDDTLEGGAGNDTLDGSAGVDDASYATAGAGVHVSLALQGGGQDTGGAGVDSLGNIENLTGSAFGDTLTGDSGANLLSGGGGDDTLDGGAWYDTLDGGQGLDTASYASAASAVAVSLAVSGPQDTGGGGTDTLVSIENLTGSSFDDVLTGDGGDSTIIGGSGNDTLDGGAGYDTLDGSGGTDTISYASASTAVGVSLAVQGGQDTGGGGTDTLIRAENLTGSNFDDVLTGDSGNNIIIGGNGNDTIDGGAGYDTLDGSGGTDTASYASATSAVGVRLWVQGGQDTGGGGTDTLIRMENLTGSAFDDILTGDANSNIIIGGSGNDTVDGGGGGTDILDGGAGSDTASFASATSAVSVNLANTGGQGTGGAGNVTLIRMENLTGSAFNDTLTGDANANIIIGGDGDDTIDGAAGADILDGGNGTDTVSYASAASAVSVSLAVAGGQGTGGGGNDTLIRFENLTGSGFNDTLRGDSGANVLTGGGGNDTFVFAALSDSTTSTPDLIADFATGDLINLSGIDADSASGGDQAFHLGGGGGHAGDIVVSYNAGTNRTTLDLYVDNDGTVDARILLVGDQSSIAAGDFLL